MAYPITVTASAVQDELLLQGLRAVEELGRPFEFQIRLLCLNPGINPDDMLGQNITIAAQFDQSRTRYFNGEVVEFRRVTFMHLDKQAYEAVLRPKFWLLSHTSDCRIFQNKSVKDILQEVLRENGITDLTLSLSGTYNPREYCVQYNESDFHFLSRLMEEEGIYYFFTHEDGKHTMVLADAYSAHTLVSGEAGNGEVPYQERATEEEESITDWTLTRQLQSGTYVHRNFDFTKPRQDLTAQKSITRQNQQSTFEVFHYPGSHLTTGDGQTRAGTRIEELQAPWELVSGKTDAVEFSPGALFKLVNYPLESQNREYLIVQANYEVTMEIDTAAADDGPTEGGLPGTTFACRFVASHSQRPFRTASITPRPVIRGPQTALVVGQSGEEIWTDAHGRVRLHFHWDRLGQKNETSSCWVRVAQVWAGKSFGIVQIPRIGDEVIVDFLEGDPDQPIVIGRVYNADQTPPYTLPANQTQSGIKTHSSKQGTADTFNELRFEDLKDSEEIYFHAEKNFNRIVENNDTLKVGFEKKDAGDQTIDIYNNRTTTLEKGTDKLQVKELHRVALIDKGNDTLQIAEGNREATIDKGNDTLTIKAGNQTITIEQGKGTIEACSELLLKVGDSTIKITPSSIEMASVNIKLEASGNFEAKGAQSKVVGSGTLDLDGGTISLN